MSLNITLFINLEDIILTYICPPHLQVSEDPTKTDGAIQQGYYKNKPIQIYWKIDHQKMNKKIR